MNQENQLLQDLKQVVLDNLGNEQFGVEQLAHEAGISRSHLHRRLKKLKGSSVSQFIREIRLEEAMKMLQNDEATISEIAYRVGFNSPSYFHKCFHSRYGYPAGEVKLHSGKETRDYPILGSQEEVSINPVVVKNSWKKRALWFIGLTVLVGLLSYFLIVYPRADRLVEKSIAVLPFVNLSEDKRNQHFADGLVEDLLSRLSLIEEFKVISRTSSDTYRERGGKNVSEIANELGVAYIVEGSVQKHEDRARITVQLIDARHDEHIWYQSFDKNVADVFDVQREVAIRVASELSSVLTKKQISDLEKDNTKNLKAFEFYLLGRHHWKGRNDDFQDRSIAYFEKAIAEDPNYALAYAGMADTYYLMSMIQVPFQSLEDHKVNKAKSIQLAEKALKIDPELVEAYTVLASVYFYASWEWEKAEEAFAKAFTLNTNHSTLHHRYSEFLSYMGKHEAAREHINRALELDPLSFIVRLVSAKLYVNRGEFQKALQDLRICEELNSENHYILSQQFFANYMLSDGQASRESLKKINALIKACPELHIDKVYEAAGLEGLMEWYIESLFYWDYWNKARVYSLLGENAVALDYLEKEFERGGILTDVPFWYSPNGLHEHPRFINQMEEMNLPYEPEVIPVR